MSIIKKITTSIIFLGLMSSTALADAVHPASHESVGKFLVKLRGGYSMMDNKASTTASTASTIAGSELKGSYLGEMALGYHFSENFAVEGSVGYNSATLKIAGAAPVSTTVSIVPATALIQYYFVPEATLSPYVGAGYSYQLAFGGSNGASVSSGGGPVGQLGFDVLFDDLIGDNSTMGLNFDLKYTYQAPHNISFTGQNKLNNKVSTAAAAIGVTFEF